jgi:phage terminase large subunit-like protein
MATVDVTDIEDFDLETLLAAEAEYQRYNRLFAMYQPGPYSLEHYPKHSEILEAGAKFRHRCFMGGNGTGKTYGLGGYETALHLTGLYPLWWAGHRFDTPIDARACGDTRETVRDIIQKVMLGDFAKLGQEAFGTGMIPRHLLGKPKIVQNTNGSVDFVPVKHVTGGWSMLEFRAYEQGRKAFQGTSRHWIWEDEEPPEKIHQENVQRGRGVDGRMLLTYTPLSGYTEVVNNFMNWERANKEGASRFTVFCDWDDVPHLDEEWKRNTLAETPAYMRKARKSGVPTAGIGMVYPVEEEFITVKPFEIPKHFRRIGGFDHGWHNTAAIWLAHDVDTDIAYLYSEYKRGETMIENHATALKGRGAWIPFRGDASARESDGEQIIHKYKAQGVKMQLATKGVDNGIQDVISRLESGRLKVFSTCVKWLDEFRRYQYKENGLILKVNDHLMDCTRYACVDIKNAIHQPTGHSSVLTSDVRF